MEKYLIDKVIGEGTYGIVYRATEKGSTDHVAIKKFKTVQGAIPPGGLKLSSSDVTWVSATDEQLSKREIQACSMLSHAFIVSYRHNFRHDGLLHLVFDHVPDSMDKLLARNRRGVKPALAQRLIYQLCQALQYCHASRVIHRDVKPDNILIDDNGDIHLCDFGVARTIQFEGDPLSDYVATRWYRPPEQELRMDRYSFDADMWSVGCVLMELLTGRPLFPGNTQIDQLNLIQEYLGPLPQPLASRLPRGVIMVKSATKSFEQLLRDRELPDGTIDFLVHTIHLEPKHRISASASLTHPFLKPLYAADQRARKHREQEEKQRRSRQVGLVGATDSEDGIEEEIPGARHADAKSPVSTPTYKTGARSVGFKGLGDEVSDAKCTRRHGTPKRVPASETKAYPGKARLSSDNNPTDCDSDDIQEIIEMDEPNVASPSKAGPGPQREPSSDHQECYEDDFEC